MKHAVFAVGAAIQFLLPLQSHAGVGQSAVITLVFPYGARSAAMGEIGTALADDGSALFFNPAGLAVANDAWIGGSATGFFEPLLPAFHIKELWHSAVAGYYQDTSSGMGQFGFFYNHINMGKNVWADELGRILGTARSHEEVVALCWGFDIRELGLANHHFGFGFKYINSALAPGIGPYGAGVARSLAVDLGYLWTFGGGFRFGTTLMNMGPSVYYLREEMRDPIPFTINVALGYKRSILVEDIKFIAVAAEYRLDREFVKSYADRKPEPFYRALVIDATDEPRSRELLQVNRHYGGEITLLNTLSLRTGYLIDVAGRRYERNQGFGVSIFNHFSYDWAMIYAPEGFMRSYAQRYGPDQTGASGARHKQWRVSITASGVLNWNENDFQWWKSKE